MKSQEILDFISIENDERHVKLSNEDIEREIRLVDLHLKREELEGNKQDRKERKDYSSKTYWLMFAFLCSSIVIVFLSGIRQTFFMLSENVLIALLSTMSVNVIGIFAIVMKYLFRQKD
jgi:hypothetical protein